jgi:hypothetical protein
MGSWSEVIDYCRTSMAFESREFFRVLFLDEKNGLIRDEIEGAGTVDHTPVYPREVVKRALELSATAIILVHNHPSGDPTPSPQDIKMTLDIIALAEGLGGHRPRPHHRRTQRAFVAPRNEIYLIADRPLPAGRACEGTRANDTNSFDALQEPPCHDRRRAHSGLP